MKKSVFVFFALLLLAMLPAAADADSTVLTLEIPQPSYQLNIPSGTGLAYGQQRCELAVPTVRSASDFKEGMALRVAVSYSGCFTGEGGEIPYSLAMTDGADETGWNSGDCLIFDATAEGGLRTNGRTPGGMVPNGMVVTVAPSAWEAAYPGSYTAAITYSAAISKD